MLTLFDVVGAQDAADVGVVFSVAVGFAREVGALELGDVVGEVGVPGGHLGLLLPLLVGMLLVVLDFVVCNDGCSCGWVTFGWCN